MANPTYRIYYGKYPDKTDQEIPNACIKSVDGMQFRMEAGKPGEPKVDSISFTLENLHWNGTERYDSAWFDNESRSQAEGGLFPMELFFTVEIIDTGARFQGVFDTNKYSAYRDEVTVQIKSILELVRDNNLRMLNEIKMGQMEFYDPLRNFDGTDLAGDSINAEYMVCSTIHDMNGRQRLIEHFGYTNINQVPEGAPDGIIAGGQTYEADPFYNGPAYLKVNEITLLVNLQIGHTGDYIDLYFWHMNNDNITVEGGTILQRGRFFRNAEGDDLEPVGYDVTVYLPNVGHTPNIMIDENELPASFFIGGIRTTEPDFSSETFSVQESAEGADYLDLFDYTISRLKESLFNRYYFNTPDNFTKLFDRTLYAFWADFIMLGWAGSTGDILVNLATAANSYLFVNEQGDIVFQDRLQHISSLPDNLPAGAFEVQIEDIKPLGSQDSSLGFDSFTIDYADRIPVNNVESDQKISISVDDAGKRDKPALRNTKLTIEIYRTDDLGVPNQNDPADLPALRYSPDDPDFINVFNPPYLSLDYFIPLPVNQVQQFAQSWTYPTTTWNIQWDMTKYPQAGIGAYFWVDWGSENRVYLIRQITHDPDQLLHKMEVQQVGVWNG